MTHQSLERESKHTKVDCTYDVILVDGKKYLQLDTYGSAQREIKGKKSQSIRLSPEAIEQLKKIFLQNNL
ncbi:MAG: methionyl-tRNA formyltransferase [Geobacter sp.]|nr:MAG: methionyl-tRNA formyltransferase [Geobacter sp.]